MIKYYVRHISCNRVPNNVTYSSIKQHRATAELKSCIQSDHKLKCKQDQSSSLLLLA